MRGFGPLLLLPVVAKLASAQFNVSSVPESTRETWCTNQQAACPIICSQTSANSSETLENDCDPETLDYSCLCSNNLSPNASEYSQTIPFYICTATNQECISNCGGNTQCEFNCNADNPCGAQNPTRINATTSSASATASSTGSGSANQATNSAGQTIYSGLGSSGGAAATGSSNTNTGAAAALQLGQAYGLLAVSAGIFAGFGLLL
ncbi:hypothetical protein E4T43_07807 [Aureobasidium subglaciale]|nr:hypothetical protein E4T43_07807 [Aureobasidium subglaciale]